MREIPAENLTSLDKTEGSGFFLEVPTSTIYDTGSIVSSITTNISATINTSVYVVLQQECIVRNFGGRITGLVSEFVNKEGSLDARTIYSCSTK